MSLVGIWHIYKMEKWDKKYFNMEVQAYIKVGKNLLGDFQFGLIEGCVDGEMEGRKRLSFSFDGADENDPCSGRGYIELVDKDIAKGKFYIHQGDSSEFLARRAE